MKRSYQLLMGTIMMLFLGLIYAWSVFRVPLEESFSQWSQADLSLTFTIAMVSFCTGIIVAGKLLEKVKPRWILLASGILSFIGFMGASFFLSPEDPQGSLKKLYFFYGVLCGFGVGIGYNALLNAILGWFPDRTGLASGVLLMGFGLGGLILGGLSQNLIESRGIFLAFRFIGIGFLIAALVVSLFLRRPKKEEVRAFLPEQKTPVEMTGQRASEMLKTSYFYLFYLWQIAIAAGGLLVINSSVPIANYFGASVLVALIVSIFNGAGRVLLGGIFDSKGPSVAIILNSFFVILGGIFLYLTALTHNPLLLWLGLPIIGLAYGGVPALNSAITRERWGPKHYSVNFGVTSTNLMFAAYLGPYLSGALQDRSGDFTSTFLMLIGFGIIALIAGLLLTRKAVRL